MNLAAAFITRLKEIDPAVFSIVGGAGKFASVDNVPNAMPAAFVLIEEEASGPNERDTGKLFQPCEADIAVIIVTQNLSDETGEAAGDDLEMLKQAVRGALVGFVPDATTGEPVEHIGGNLLKAKSGVVWHRELFAASHYIEEQS